VEVLRLYIIQFRFAHSHGETMATSVRSNGRKVRLNNNNRGRVGEFFEHLAKATVGGEFNENEDIRYGDLIDLKLYLGVEVKSSDNGHPFRIGLNQKRRYEEMLFPLDHFAYCFCSYKNYVRAKRAEGLLRTRGRKAGMITLLHRYDKKAEQFKVLADTVDEVFLIDLEVMNALEKKIGIFPSSHPGRQGEREMRLIRRDLRPLVNGSFTKLISDMGLSPEEWTLGKFDLERTISIESETSNKSETYTSRFTLHTILKQDLHKRFCRSRRLGRNKARRKKPSLS
jgi:hypothetical protein